MEHKNQVEVEQQILPSLTKSEEFEMTQRRSANYKPNVWKYSFLQSLSSKYNEEQYERQAEELKMDLKNIFVDAEDELAKLELVDSIKKLGLECHFEKEMKEALDTAAASIESGNLKLDDNLYVTALCFRLFRQHGYEVSEDILGGFVDEMGPSKCADIKGLVELYEASYLALEGEMIMNKAKASTARILKGACHVTIESNVAKQVNHVLELPSHWRAQWYNVKWHINAYEQGKNMNKTLFDLAKLNFNMVQATLQNDLKEISRWWSNLGLMESLNFTRDRLVESFLCTVGLVTEPQYSNFRKSLTKAILMVLVIDDVYDIYGSFEELQHFTNAINRWDSREVQQLPQCMRICFQALDDIINEIACELQREKGRCYVQPYLKKVWADFCGSLFVEAKWYNTGYTPSLQEYLSNAWISSSGTVLAVHSFFYIMNEATEEMATFLEKNKDLVYNISMIIRLCNDLGTAVAEQERGDAASSIACLMREVNVSEDGARIRINEMINKLWMKINRQCFGPSPTLQLFVNVITNMARVAHNLYDHGDKFAVQDRENKNQILSLLVEPLKL